MQSLTTSFHRSMYITLGLACACLGYAELAFLPEMSAFAACVGVLLIVAYYVEGRWALSLRAANILGGVISAVAVVWIAYQFVRPYGALIDQLPSPTWLLPYLGPLLMILIPAKLFRPKHDGDFWALQGIGIIAVALGCALTGDPLFGVLLFAYLISGLWSLILFYYYRQGKLAGGGPVRPASAPRSLSRAGRWASAATIVAVGLFLCTPRATEARWELSGISGRFQTGVDENRPVIDLNRSGTLTVNRDKVIEVYASIDREGTQPKLDLDAGQRWRQMPFDSYENGRWDNRPYLTTQTDNRFAGRGPDVRMSTAPRPNELPDLGPGQYYLMFHSHSRVGRRIQAEPIVRPVDAEGRLVSTVANVTGIGRQIPWSSSAAGEMSPPAVLWGGPEYSYKQVTKPPDEPGLGVPYFAGRREPELAELDHLRDCGAVPHLRDWSQGLLKQLVEQGRIPGVTREEAATGVVSREHYEAVCRAFEAYLAQSDDFKYSLTLTRQDTQLDPIEDFVLNIKKGHCSRFATALALMLRSVGVPTRIVLGYRGYETNGNGLYEVLQCHAHSWVEALIVRPGVPSEPSPAAGGGQGWRWRWLTLDPTPSGEDAEAGEFSWNRWWEFVRLQVNGLFKDFIVEYDEAQQDRTRYAISQSNWRGVARASQRLLFGPNGDDWLRATAIGLAGIGIAWGLRTLVRRRRTGAAPAGDPAFAFYRRLVATMERALGLVPLPGQTPREFAAFAEERLRTNQVTRPLADVPRETAHLYYRVRFGTHPLDAAERAAVDASLDQLEQALAGPARG